MNQRFFSHVIHSSKRGRRIGLMITLFAMVFVFSAFSFAPAAHAATIVNKASNASTASKNQTVKPLATNGEELEVATLAYSVYVVGHNQNGTLVASCWNTPYYYNYLSGWWWKGTVDIYSYNSTGCTNATGYYTQVNVTNQSGNWFLVYVYPD